MCRCRKYQVVAPRDKIPSKKNLCPTLNSRQKHTCNQHRPFLDLLNSWRASRSCTALWAFCKQHSQFLQLPAERKTVLCEKFVISWKQINFQFFKRGDISECLRPSLFQFGCRITSRLSFLFILGKSLFFIRIVLHTLIQGGKISGKIYFAQWHLTLVAPQYRKYFIQFILAPTHAQYI